MSENMELETKDIVTSSEAENEAVAADTADNAKEKETAPKDNNVSDESFSKKIGNKILIAALAVYAFVISVVGIVSYLSPEKAQEEDILNLIQLGQYKDLNVSVEKATVTDEEINEQIESLVTNSGGIYTDTDQPIKEGDRITADITLIEENGEPVSEEHTDYDVQLVMTSGQAPDEFIAALTGKKIGDTATAVLSAGDAGETVTYKLAVTNNASLSTEPTDEFVESLEIDGVHTVADLRESVSNFIINYKNDYLEQKVKEQLLALAIENATYKDIPQELYDQYRDNFYIAVDRDVEAANAQAQDEESKTTAKDFIKQKMEEVGFSGTEEEYVNALADYEIKTNLAILKIADIENLKPDESRVYSLAAADWKDHTEEYPTLLDFAQANGTAGYELEVNKEDVMEILYQNAVITEVEPSSDEAPSDNTVTDESIEVPVEVPAGDTQETVTEESAE